MRHRHVLTLSRITGFCRITAAVGRSLEWNCHAPDTHLSIVGEAQGDCVRPCLAALPC
jgi:hypothetical protein